MIGAREFTVHRRLALLLALATVSLSVLLSGLPAYAGVSRAPVATGAELTATLLPGAEDGTRLAVDWRGAAGARLGVTLGTSERPDRVLVAERPLRSGANLLTLPVHAGASGTLRLRVEGGSGVLLRTLVQELDELRAESEFAWAPESSVAAVPPGLIVGGIFGATGAGTANNIARLNGSTWSSFTGPGGTGADSQVAVLGVFDGDLIAGGSFMYAGGNLVRGIARWDGTDWLPLTGSSGTGVMTMPFDFVASLAVYNGDLIVGGQFLRAGSVPVNHVARWDGAEWYPLTGPSGTGVDYAAVRDLAIYGGALIVGGGFTQAGGIPASRIARWNGSTWSTLGAGLGTTQVTADVAALTIYNGALIAAGYFDDAAGVTANHVARWNGTAWSVLTGPSGTGTSDPVRDVTVYNGALIVAGHFTHAGGLPVNYIARWNGSAWSGLTGPSGTGTNSTVYTVTVRSGALIVGGDFSQAGGVSAGYLGRWNGTAWSAVSATGPNGPVFALLSA
ncbi:hypothetical protein [Plantactinospora soyae]|uniref:Cortical protein marker for cell polarity n=1 Tax=Plantactinospora soyae TaxID=1544732 RepID=A0A927M710_9ACTN|nr:hypothetical protein [Plantactinospora soyae]MBE1488045.1 hypothetical protein [Plantactinospora soyae]